MHCRTTSWGKDRSYFALNICLVEAVYTDSAVCVHEKFVVTRLGLELEVEVEVEVEVSAASIGTDSPSQVIRFRA